MKTKKFKLDAGTLHLKTKRRADSDKQFGIGYRTKKNGIQLKLSGFFSTEQERDKTFADFKRPEAQDFLRGMHDFVAQKKPATKNKPSTKSKAA